MGNLLTCQAEVAGEPPSGEVLFAAGEDRFAGGGA